MDIPSPSFEGFSTMVDPRDEENQMVECGTFQVGVSVYIMLFLKIH